jgi:GNAT superfamily N-acetyltransferase
MYVVGVPWTDPRAALLRQAMSVEMAARYGQRPGEEPAALHLDPADIVAVGLALEDDGTAVGHAALRQLRTLRAGVLEVKRVVVTPGGRGRGTAQLLMAWIERRALELGATRLVLQTGVRQPEAMALYERLGWTPIATYAPYEGLPMSRCYAKELTARN